MADNTFLAPLSPIQRSTPSDRLISFEKNERNIYNKFSPYYQAGGGIGPDQPFVYTKLTDSNFQKSLTKYDSQALPVGSTARDVIRITKFSVTGAGVLYAGKQLLLQGQNAFNETRIYNPLSLIKATARPGAVGLIDRPQRHLETSGGLLNFFRDALLSTFGFSTRDANKPIEGTAAGINGDGISYSNYAGIKGGAKYGLMRFNTGNNANSKFKSIWGIGAAGGGSGGLARGFLDRLRSLIPSTNPLGAYAVNQLGQRTTASGWTFRPEYDTAYQEGIYFSFLEDRSNLMITPANRNAKVFYNDASFAASSRTDRSRTPRDFHFYTPGKSQTIFGTDNQDNYYASDAKIQRGSVGLTNIQNTYLSMLRAIQPYNNVKSQFRKSTEGYSNDTSKGVNSDTNYKSIPDGINTNNATFVDKSTVTEGPYLKYLREKGQVVNEIKIDNRGFAKARTNGSAFGTPDTYNQLSPNIKNKGDLSLANDPNQSKDLIFFYFYDLINQIYIPFRATLGSVSDQHSPEWEPIKYMGRADSLFVYKGFTRDVNFNFKVYANSIDELVPMWKRVNYIAGLTRPSKYTDRAYQTNETSTSTAQGNELQSQVAGQDLQTGITTMTPFIVNESRAGQTTGAESGFIYPPMIEFRIGDMYVDQPAILKSVNITVPEDANWETLRGDEYSYVYGVNKILKKPAKSRQLPTIVDVSVQLSLLEREKSITSANHFGPRAGWETTL